MGFIILIFSALVFYLLIKEAVKQGILEAREEIKKLEKEMAVSDKNGNKDSE